MRRSILLVTMAVLGAACTPGATTTTTTTTTSAPISTSAPAAGTTPTTAVVEPESEAGPLVVWVGSEAVAEAVTAQADAYTFATGVEVFVITFFSAPDNDRGFLDSVLEGPKLLAPDDAIAGVTDRAPDIFIGPHTWLPELAEAGLAEPVTLPEGLPTAAVQAVSLRGFTIGIPVALDAIVQYRNPTLMPAAPADVSDLQCPEEAACLLLPADGDPDVHLPFLFALGGYIFGEDAMFGFDADDVGVDTTEAIAATAILQGLIEEGGVDGAVDREDARTRFAAGEAALIWDGAEMLGQFESAVLDALPTIALNPAASPVRVTAVWVNAMGSQKTEAVEFAVGYLGGVPGSTRIARALGFAPIWADQATDAERLIIDSAEVGRTVPYIPEAVEAWKALADAFARIHAGTSAGTALIDAADRIRFQP